MTYTLRASGVTSTSYTATDLTPGLEYRFKVQSRNAYGFSYDSEEVKILCATVPSKPVPPSSVNAAN